MDFESRNCRNRRWNLECGLAGGSLSRLVALGMPDLRIWSFFFQAGMSSPRLTTCLGPVEKKLKRKGKKRA